MHLRDVTFKRLTMYRRILIAAAFILASAFALLAQTPEKKFKAHNRWMVGGELVYSNNGYPGAGFTAIYGRQFSEVLFLGIGFGIDTYIAKTGKSTTILEEMDGSQTVIIRLPYGYTFLTPVYADLQIDFSRRRSPFFGEFKIGATPYLNLTRIRGTEEHNDLEFCGAGLMFGAAAGKRFTLSNEDEISISLGVDGIIWPYFLCVPMSLNFRYSF